MKRPLATVVALAVAGALLATIGTFVYIQFVKEDAPDRLTLDAGTADGTTADDDPTAATARAQASELAGVWKVTTGSQAGYRVKEVLFGQSAEAVGRTSSVTGEMQFDGTTLRTASFSVDMTTMASDESRRDNQFRGRIMDTATHPTADFTLSSPIPIGELPAEGQEIAVAAKGKLALRGTTKLVTIPLTAQRAAGNIRVAGNLTIVFDEWGIPNPSFGPAETEDRGELEFLLVLTR
ncbi:MAG TPA: YceI family protein [Acidimicrobiales bacterium]